MNNSRKNFLAALEGSKSSISDCRNFGPKLELREETLQYWTSSPTWRPWKFHLRACGKPTALLVCASALKVPFSHSHWDPDMKYYLEESLIRAVSFLECPTKNGLEELQFHKRRTEELEYILGRSRVSSKNCYLLAAALSCALKIPFEREQKYPNLVRKCLNYCGRKKRDTWLQDKKHINEMLRLIREGVAASSWFRA